MDDLIPFSEFRLNRIEDKHSSTNDILWGTKGLQEENKVQFPGAEDCGESVGIDSFTCNFEFFPDDIPSSKQEGYSPLFTYQQKDHPHQNQQLSYLDYGKLDNLQFDTVFIGDSDTLMFDHQQHPNPNPAMVFPPLCEEPTKVNQFSTPLASLEILKNYNNNGLKRLCDEEKTIAPTTSDDVVMRRLSTEDVMRVAGTRFIQSSSSLGSSSPSSGLKSFLVNHPFGLNFSGLSNEEIEDVELAESLLACAEKVGYKQFERATKLLGQCESSSSKTDNPVKRVVHYFAAALHLRIDLETGRVSSKKLKEMQTLFDPEVATKDINPTLLSFFEKLPFCQVTMFTLVQAITENVTEAKRIHIIDLEIRKGGQWTILMQALAARSQKCPIELLKITAVGSGEGSMHRIEDTGNRLKDFAMSSKIPFCFNIVVVPDMLQLREDLFEIDPEETIAVYSQYALSSMIRQPDQIEIVMRVVRTIRPSVMVVAEIESNHNSASFFNRFIEALFYFSAFFDCFETCMKRDDPDRLYFESMYFGNGIKNIVATDGAERKSRNVKIDVWRTFFSRFGMVEAELSMVSLFQAELVAKRFPCGSCCTFDMNGNCLLFGWKGTPINSISVWKFL